MAVNRQNAVIGNNPRRVGGTVFKNLANHRRKSNFADKIKDCRKNNNRKQIICSRTGQHDCQFFKRILIRKGNLFLFLAQFFRLFVGR